MIPSKEVTGLVIKMLFNTCVEKLQKLFLSLSHMVCHSLELKKERFIKEHSEDNLEISVKMDKPTDAALSQTELDIVCSILYSEEL